MTSLSSITGIKPSRTYLPDLTWISPMTQVGIEIELENISRVSLSRRTSTHYWEISSDDSLRDGLELISKPLFGRDLSLAIEEVGEALKQISYFISIRCGLHIHIDCTKFTVQELISITCWYAILEKSLFNFAGKDRQNNFYCLPISNTDILYKYYNSIKYGNANTVLEMVESTYKYSAFNILPLTKLGTIEFRHFQSSDDPEWIKNCINIIMGIRELAKKFPIVDVINSPIENIVKYIRETIPEELLDINLIDIKEGAIIAKDILNFNELSGWWDQNKDVYEINKRISA